MFNNRPSIDTTFSPPIFATPNDLVLTSQGDTLPLYSTDISALTEALSTTYFGLELNSFNQHFFASSEFASLQNTLNGGAVTPPSLNLELINPRMVATSNPLLA